MIIYKSPNKPLSLRALYKPNQSLFLAMYHPTNTQSGPTASIKTLAIVPSTPYYLKQYDLHKFVKSILTDLKAIKDLLSTHLDKSDKQYAKLYNAQIDKKIEKQLHPISLQITEISSKQSESEVLTVTSKHPSSEDHFERKL